MAPWSLLDFTDQGWTKLWTTPADIKLPHPQLDICTAIGPAECTEQVLQAKQIIIVEGTLFRWNQLNKSRMSVEPFSTEPEVNIRQLRHSRLLLNPSELWSFILRNSEKQRHTTLMRCGTICACWFTLEVPALVSVSYCYLKYGLLEWMYGKRSGPKSTRLHQP